TVLAAVAAALTLAEPAGAQAPGRARFASGGAAHPGMRKRGPDTLTVAQISGCLGNRLAARRADRAAAPGETPGMSGGAAALREDSRDRQRRMTPELRLAKALAFGRRDIIAFAAARGVDETEARRRERAAQAGRVPSRVMRQLAE